MGSGGGSHYLDIRDPEGNQQIKFDAHGNSFINGGKVGIGTTEPKVKLEVIKGGTSVSTVENNLTAKFSDSNGWSGIGIYGKKECGSFVHLGYSGNDKAVELLTFNNCFYIKTNGSYRFRIGQNGNIAIGKNISEHKLDVAGTIRADEIRVEDIAANNLNLAGDLAANNITVKANGQTADFVFEEDYNLKDLSEVEAYIKEHKHLENIPSAIEMEEQGVNLAEMNKLLLQKIEELTLHTITQDKKLKEKDKEVESLEEDMCSMKKELQALKEMILDNK